MQDRVRRLIADGHPCDMTLPWSWEPGDQSLRAAMPGRYRAAGWAYVSLTLAFDDEDIAATIRMIARERREILERDDCVLVERVEDIRRAKREGKIALGFHSRARDRSSATWRWSSSITSSASGTC